MRALVIDTVPATAAIVRESLDLAGWEVTEASDDPSTVLAALATDVDLVVVDLALSNVEPMALIAELREASPHQSILALTAGPSTREGVLALLAGADNFLVKPFSRRELQAHLGTAARRRIWSTRARSRLQELITGVMSEVADAVIITNADGRIRSFNAAAEDLYGVPAGEVLGQPGADVLRWVGAETAFEVARAQLAESGAWHGVAEQYRRDGSIVRVRSSTQVLEDDEGRSIGFISVNRPFDHDRTDAERQAFQIGQDEMLAGLAADEFVVHYQPIFLVEDRTIIGVEALVRWQHGDDLRQPDAFIAAAEETDVIVGIGEVVVQKACRQLQEWRELGHDLHLTVNLAARQLMDSGLVGMLSAALASSGIDPHRLTLEVTETALIHDVDAARRVLLRIADLGVGVSIDDFGTGWASLTYLQQLPVSCLKIDRTFVARLGVDRRDTAIVRSVIALGRELDLVVIAEGIETFTQLEHLRLLGCRFGQGFAISRPLPAADLFVSV